MVKHHHKISKEEWGYNLMTGEKDCFCKCGKLMKTIKAEKDELRGIKNLANTLIQKK